MEVDRIVWENVRIPESCKGVDIVIGIDEAGRGPVLGPLVYAAAFWPLSEDAEIQKMGFNDSKQLKEGDRDGFFGSIRNHPSIGWVIEEISAADISRVQLNSHFEAIFWFYIHIFLFFCIDSIVSRICFVQTPSP